VAARLGPLGDDQVAAGVDRRPGMVDLPAHAPHQDAVVMAQVDHLGGDPEAGHEQAHALADGDLDQTAQVACEGDQQVDPEGPFRQPADGLHLLDHPVAGEGGGAQGAVAARLGDGRHQAGVGDAAHPGEHHGMLDAEQLGQSGLHGFILCLMALRLAAHRSTVGGPCPNRRPKQASS
jgi:hypothetical protein